MGNNFSSSETVKDGAPVFVLGMPRCRTAWLSLCLSALGVDCTHEAIRDRGSFAEYAEELDARLEQGAAGDSDPGLVYWIEDLFERWPEARFVVVSRHDHAALEATVRAAPAWEGVIRQGWAGYLLAFKSACDALRQRAQAGSTQARFWQAEALEQDGVVADLLEWATGTRPPALWVKRRQRLRVTSKIDPASCLAPPPTMRAPAARPSLEGFDTTGLSAALYENADFETVAGWWQAHTGEALAQAALPPLGVVVRDAEGAVAACWAYECYGVPVAELVFPVTRPGLSVARASVALAYAFATCIHSAGKGHVPPADFRFFKVFAPVGGVRLMKRLGFREALTERKAMYLEL